MNDIEFWMALSELNSLTTILSHECPQYEDRVSRLKSILTKYITENLEEQKKLRKLEDKFWTVRNN